MFDFHSTFNFKMCMEKVRSENTSTGVSFTPRIGNETELFDFCLFIVNFFVCFRHSYRTAMTYSRRKEQIVLNKNKMGVIARRSLLMATNISGLAKQVINPCI